MTRPSKAPLIPPFLLLGTNTSGVRGQRPRPAP